MRRLAIFSFPLGRRPCAPPSCPLDGALWLLGALALSAALLTGLPLGSKSEAGGAVGSHGPGGGLSLDGGLYGLVLAARPGAG